MNCKDVSGLSRKAQVKIAGVNVGWIEDIQLCSDHQVLSTIMIHGGYTLHKNACAYVRQDGLLGPKFLEIIPGNPSMGQLAPGSFLMTPSEQQVSIEDIMQKFHTISNNVADVTESFKNSWTSAQGVQQLENIFVHLAQAAERIAAVTEKIDGALGSNAEHIENLLKIGTQIQQITQKLETAVFPAFSENLSKISCIVDRDFNRVAGKIESSIDSFQDTSAAVNEVAQKINEGKGFVGKLINDDSTYRDLQVATQGIRNYFNRVNMMQIIFDAHFESMYRPAEFYAFEDAKSYFDIRLHPNDDHFYLLQMAASERGIVSRTEKKYEFADSQAHHLIDLNTLDINPADRLKLQCLQSKEKFKRNTFKVGIQVGKIFGRSLALRLGLFDGYFGGLAADIDIPFNTDSIRWLMSFEAYDFRGWNRERDRRPHLKWLNRIYLLNNIYMVFGADDFISQRNANVFFGAGIRFGDDDIKYLMPNLGGLGGMLS